MLGGLLFLTGMLVMAYNVFKIVAGAKSADASVLASAPCVRERNHGQFQTRNPRA